MKPLVKSNKTKGTQEFCGKCDSLIGGYVGGDKITGCAMGGGFDTNWSYKRLPYCPNCGTKADRTDIWELRYCVKNKDGTSYGQPVIVNFYNSKEEAEQFKKDNPQYSIFMIEEYYKNT